MASPSGCAMSSTLLINWLSPICHCDSATRVALARRNISGRLSEIEIVEDAIAEAAGDRSITSSQAGDQLSETADIAKEAGSSLTDRLAVELTRDTDRNFAGIVTSAYGMLRRLPALVRGEGGFISKEFFSGFYKYAGGATAVGLVAWLPVLIISVGRL
jgi:hypothetical protein